MFIENTKTKTDKFLCRRFLVIIKAISKQNTLDDVF